MTEMGTRISKQAKHKQTKENVVRYERWDKGTEKC